VARALGKTQPPFETLAIGIDVTAAGVSRFRTYHPAIPDALAGWPPRPWPAPAPGVSHRLVTALGRPGEPGAKRTLNVIFSPGAPMRGLLEVAPDLDAAWLGALDRRCRAHGLVLRPVASEIDVFEDGSERSDALVAIGRPR
jgi:hypothetical protein